MVERLLCKQDVSGSSPLTSICEPQRKNLRIKEEIQHLLKNNLLERNLQTKHLENCIEIKRSQVVLRMRKKL